MKPHWGAQIIQLTSAMEVWRTTLPKLPPAFRTAQGVDIPTEDLGVALEEIYAALQKIDASIDIDPILLSIHQQGVLSQADQVSSLINSLPANLSPQTLDQIAQNLWGIRASLVWLVAPKLNPNNFLDSVADLDLNLKLAALKSLVIKYSEEVANSTALSKEILESEQKVSAALKSIKEQEKIIQDAKLSAENSATTAAENKEAIATQLGELSAALAQESTLFGRIEELRDKAQSTLESSSKVALAAAFSERKKQLTDEAVNWRFAFYAGIFFMLFFSVIILTGLGLIPSIIVNGGIDLSALLARLLVLGPPIWFTWFSVKQYGNARRLIEDYAFKEASALAFVGYQKEMHEDVDMIRLLRESAIRNFGNQPTRIFEKSDPTSPLHEMLDKAIDKGGLDKFADMLSKFYPGKSGN